ncbi:MAG: hypothetical protein DDT29_02416 [Dehalococcoidia bacterium]|nr:hypothetical protein [Bacillota bacterium]
MKRKNTKGISILLTVILLMSAFAIPAAAGQESGGKRRNVPTKEIQHLDAEVQVIAGQPVLRYQTGEGYAEIPFEWPTYAISADGQRVPVERQGEHLLLPTAAGMEKVAIKDFQVAIVAGQLVLLKSVNPWFTIPVAVAIAALKTAGVAVTTATVKAATILIATGKSVTARTVSVVVAAFPVIRAALVRAGRVAGSTAVGVATVSWLQGNCILCGRRTPDGHFGAMFCSLHAQRFGQFYGPRL